MVLSILGMAISVLMGGREIQQEQRQPLIGLIAATLQQQVDVSQNALLANAKAAGGQVVKELGEQVRSATIGRLATATGFAAILAGVGEGLREGGERQTAAARLRFGEDRRLTRFERIAGASVRRQMP